jgi:hypothetical protein
MRDDIQHDLLTGRCPHAAHRAENLLGNVGSPASIRTRASAGRHNTDDGGPAFACATVTNMKMADKLFGAFRSPAGKCSVSGWRRCSDIHRHGGRV